MRVAHRFASAASHTNSRITVCVAHCARGRPPALAGDPLQLLSTGARGAHCVRSTQQRVRSTRNCERSSRGRGSGGGAAPPPSILGVRSEHARDGRVRRTRPREEKLGCDERTRASVRGNNVLSTLLGRFLRGGTSPLLSFILRRSADACIARVARAQHVRYCAHVVCAARVACVARA